MSSATAPERLDTVTHALADGRIAASPATVWRFWTEPAHAADHEAGWAYLLAERRVAAAPHAS